MNLVFFGSGSFGLPTLERLTAGHRVTLVVTQPDRPAGRHRHLTPTPVAQYAADHDLVSIKPADVNDAETISAVGGAGADAFVVIAFGQKLGPPLLDDVFAVNLHASLLPKYRGAAPVNWAMINGEAETGVSVITITQRIDAGDVLGRRVTRIDPMETAGELQERLAAMGPEFVHDILDRYEAGRLEPVPQDERLASTAPRLTKSDGTVRFDQPATVVQRRVHGLNPWPGCTVALAGDRLKLRRAEVVAEDAPHAEPGRVLDDDTVACSSGRIRLLAVQPPGGKVMTLSAYANGHQLGTGARMEPL